jgi:hypothetical protein
MTPPQPVGNARSQALHLYCIINGMFSLNGGLIAVKQDAFLIKGQLHLAQIFSYSPQSFKYIKKDC